MEVSSFIFNSEFPMNKKRFFLKLIIVTGCLMLADKGLGLIWQHYYIKIIHGEQGRTNYAIDSCTAETIILGSSRAEHHYVSPIISEILNTSCYNAGKDKQRLRYALAMLKMMYRRYVPKLVILDLNPTAFEITESGLDELSVLLPYYRSHPEIRSIVNERNRFEWIKTWSDLYCYNSLPLKILFNNISDERDAGEMKGYVPLVIRKEFIPDSPDSLPPAQPVDSSIVDCFKQIIRITKDQGTRLMVVVSPIYYRLPKNLPTMVTARKICADEKIAFLDYSQSLPFLNHGPDMYLDMGHLNDSSAILFSRTLAHDIRESYDPR
jgi:hypothetical protein